MDASSGSPGAPGPVTIRSRARSTTAATVETAGAGITVSIVAGHLPVPEPLERSRPFRLIADVDDPSPVELGVKFRSDINGFITGVRFYKSAEQHRHAHRQPVDEHRHAAGDRDVHERDAVGLAAGALRRRRSRSPRTRPTSCRITPTSATTRRRGGYFSSLRRRCAAAACADQRRRRRQRRLPVRTTRVPDADVQRHQLLGRRGVRQHAGHDRAGDCRRGAVPLDGATAIVTWTTDEPSTSSVDYSTDGCVPAGDRRRLCRMRRS